MKYICPVILLFLIVGCSTSPSESVVQTAIAQTEIARPTMTPFPTQTVTPSPTPIPSVTPTSTPALIQGPISKYLSSNVQRFDISNEGIILTTKNMLSLPTKNEDIIRFQTTDDRPILGRSFDGTPSRFVYWVNIADSINEEIERYEFTNEQENRAALFGLVFPSEVTYGTILELSPNQSNCDELHIYKTSGDLLVSMVIIQANCRIRNLGVLYLSAAVDNYDGFGQHIPDEVLLKQTMHYLYLVVNEVGK